MKKGRIFFSFLLTFIYLEFIFRVVCVPNMFSFNILYGIIYVVFLSCLLKVISSLFSDKVNKIIFRSLLIFINLFYIGCILFTSKFGVYFSIDSLGFTNQLGSFMGDVFKIIGSNILLIILCFIPSVLSFILKYEIKRPRIEDSLLLFLLTIMVYLVFMRSLNIYNQDSYSVFNLYYKVNNVDLMIEKIGMVPSTLIDIRKKIFKVGEDGFVKSENNEEIKEPEVDKNDEPKVYDMNLLDIEFDLASNDKYMEMNEYFSTIGGTRKNEYTGMFKDKNLILFMAESFNEIGVDKELTPTLYKLINSGFSFNNFYSPVVLSTIGGEFQELSGMYPDLGELSSKWRKGTNYYEYGLGKVFSELGYKNYAYHNNSYNFQNRDVYLKSIGFDNYLGCKNGLEKRINCNIWPQSDVEMVDKTVEDYLNNDGKFITYYATVSGHMEYTFSNAMAKKNKELVEDLEYSEHAKAYLATQIELDRSLELLLIRLEESGKLEDTVIALVGDHYPYDLELDVINELSDFERDAVVGINKSNFILWNSEMDTVEVNKVGSQIDVLPTILNLFGVDYDSRLIIGSDILSESDGLAMFSNNSWVTDKGIYYSNSNKFVPNEGVVIDDEYINFINRDVINKKKASKKIMELDYYKYLFKKE